MTSTSIIRHRHPNRFTVLPNAALRDSRLSFRATGLLAYLLSLPPDSSTDGASLAMHKREGRDAIRSAMRELVDAGYVRRFREQQPNGQWSHVTEVSDAADFQSELAGAPTPGNPTSVDPAIRDKGTVTSNKQREPVPRNVVLDDNNHLWVDGNNS